MPRKSALSYRAAAKIGRCGKFVAKFDNVIERVNTVDLTNGQDEDIHDETQDSDWQNFKLNLQSEVNCYKELFSIEWAEGSVDDLDDFNDDEKLLIQKRLYHWSRKRWARKPGEASGIRGYGPSRTTWYNNAQKKRKRDLSAIAHSQNITKFLGGQL